jgi:hypothetical protein
VTRPIWFRAAAVALLLWGVMGCYACFQQFRLGAEAIGPATDYDRALYAALPVWYNAVYAVAVGTGFLAALALLARSVLAIPLAAISLLAVLLQFGWLFATTDMIAHKGASVIGFPLLIAGVATFALWLARTARRRGWVA